MVNFLKKKKKDEVFANGRVIITDFKELKKDDFPQHEDGDVFFLHYDGRIFFDSENEASEPIVSILKILTQYSKADLRKWERKCKRLYPNIKTLKDLEKFEGDGEDFAKALSMFFVPLELESRDMQRAYYGIS